MDRPLPTAEGWDKDSLPSFTQSSRAGPEACGLDQWFARIRDRLCVLLGMLAEVGGFVFCKEKVIMERMEVSRTKDQ
jgi:hypothetical protein